MNATHGRLFTNEKQRRLAPPAHTCEAGWVYVTGKNAIPHARLYSSS